MDTTLPSNLMTNPPPSPDQCRSRDKSRRASSSHPRLLQIVFVPKWLVVLEHVVTLLLDEYLPASATLGASTARVARTAIKYFMARFLSLVCPATPVIFFI